MANAHSRVAPSGLALTVACPGSLRLQESVSPCVSSEPELEGDAGHLVAAARGHGDIWPVGKTFTMMHTGARVWTVTDDMYDGAREWVAAMGGAGNLRVEEGVRCADIHPDCFGTPDGWRYFPAGTYRSSRSEYTTSHAVLRVGDYKFGHRFVDEFENFQMVAYARGIMALLNLTDSGDPLVIEFIIVQPRCYSAPSVRIWRVFAEHMRTLVNVAHNAVEDALGDLPPTRTSEHCLDCKARHLCGTLRTASTRIVEYAGAADVASDNVDPLSLGQELAILDDAAKLLEARRTGLSAHVEALVRAGVAVPHYALQPMRANMKWNDDTTPEQVHAAMALFGVDAAKPFDIKTPRQVIDSGVDESIVLDYATRPKGRLALKRDSATRARKLFSQTAR